MSDDNVTPINPPGYKPPSIADGTVAQGLIEGLDRLADEYGLAGVVETIAEWAETWKDRQR